MGNVVPMSLEPCTGKEGSPSKVYMEIVPFTICTFDLPEGIRRVHWAYCAKNSPQTKVYMGLWKKGVELR